MPGRDRTCHADSVESAGLPHRVAQLAVHSAAGSRLWFGRIAYFASFRVLTVVGLILASEVSIWFVLPIPFLWTASSILRGLQAEELNDLHVRAGVTPENQISPSSAVFWSLLSLLTLGVSGLILDFAIWKQVRHLADEVEFPEASRMHKYWPSVYAFPEIVLQAFLRDLDAGIPQRERTTSSTTEPPT